MDNNYNLIYIFLLIIFIGSLFLQVYLSKRKDKVSGLILPAIYFLSSFRALFALWKGDIGVDNIIQILLLRNLPTLILIAIYILYRRRINRNKEIEKMNIQDLE